MVAMRWIVRSGDGSRWTVLDQGYGVLVLTAPGAGALATTGDVGDEGTGAGGEQGAMRAGVMAPDPSAGPQRWQLSPVSEPGWFLLQSQYGADNDGPVCLTAAGMGHVAVVAYCGDDSDHRFWWRLDAQ
jgi:hypothetical protein